MFMHVKHETGLMLSHIKVHLILACALSALSVFADHMGNSIVMLFINGLYILMACIASPLDRTIYVFAALPNTKCLLMAGVSDAVLICFLSVLQHILLNKECNGKLLILSMLYFMTAQSITARYADISYGVIFPVKMIAVLWYFYIEALLLSNSSIECEVQRMEFRCYALTLGILAAFIPSLLLSTTGGRYEVAGNDSNILAVEAVFALSLASVLYFQTSSFRARNFYFTVISMGGVCLMTGSRNGLLLIAISMLCIFIFNIKKLGKIAVFAILIVVAGMIFLRTDMAQGILDTLQVRMQAMTDRGDISNGRFELWTQYIQTFNESPLNWLFGLGDYKYHGITMQAHNMILEDISSYGLVGMLMLSLIYILIRKEAKSSIEKWGAISTKKKLFEYLPVFIVLLGGLTLRTMTNVINTSMLYAGAILPYLLAHPRSSSC